jgi:drug/metabolite transporter (DMT)-like permease
MPQVHTRAEFSVMDGLLVLMVVIWGLNYSAFKQAFQEIAPHPFNAMRMMIASVVFLTAIRLARRRARTGGGGVSAVFYTPTPLSVRDRWDLLWLGLVGHTGYQLCFASGLGMTSVSNAALIIGATPVVIATLSAALGRERIGRLHWIGAAVSAGGIYFVVGHNASFGGATVTGDLIMLVAVACWAAYTLGGSRLMARHSPLYVTGITMAIGAVPYGLAALPALAEVPWAAISLRTWVTLVLSALLALCLAYLIWYTAVQRLGAARTSIYSNVIPIVAMAFAAIVLGEPITATKMIGAAAVLAGVFLTRLGGRPAAVPPEC